MVKIFISIVSLFLISCSEINTNKSEMDIVVENNTSCSINKILIRYGNEQFQINKLKKGVTVKNTILVSSDMSFDITIYNDKGKQITINNVGYYYYNGKNNVKLIFNNRELVEKKENSKDGIEYSYSLKNICSS